MRRLRFPLFAVLLVGPVVAQVPNPPLPPVAKKVPHTVTLHGETRSDDYFWLKEKTNPEVIKYLEAENAYTAAVTKPHRAAPRHALQGDARPDQTDRSRRARPRERVLVLLSHRGGKQYPIHCRKKGSLDAAEEVLLDGNELAKGQKFFSFGELQGQRRRQPARVHHRLTGFREYELSVKDLRTGK